MKKWLLFLSVCFCLLSACGAEALPASGGNGPPEPAPQADASAEPAPRGEDGRPTVLTCRVVDGAEEGELLLAELGEGLYGGRGVYRLSLNGSAVPQIFLDGQPTTPPAIEDGMTVEIAFYGPVEETFPAQVDAYRVKGYSTGTEKNPGGTYYDLCGLYLQVLDGLWQKDPALNEDIAIAGLDLSQAPGGLTESEQAALAWRFGELHGVEVVTGTFEELRDQGYFTAKVLRYTDGGSARQGEAPVPLELYEWEDGCLFSITANETHSDEVYSLPALFFNAGKWRAPLAAYSFYDCSAVWPENGTWSGYQVGAEMIA